MSTKTTFKRIALVAVSAMGLGFVSVIPASAAAITTTAATVGTTVQAISVGAPASTTVGFTTAAATTADAADTFTSTTVTITAVPTGSTVTLADRDGAGATATAAFSATGGTTNFLGEVNSATGAVTRNTAAATAASIAAGAIVAGTVTIVPDVAGIYEISVATGGAGLGVATRVAYIYAYANAQNTSTLFGTLGDGGWPSNNANVVGVAGIANTVTVRGFPSTTVRRLVTVDGSGAYIASSTTSAVTTAGSTSTTARVIDAQALGSTFTDFVVGTPTVGTITVKIFSETAVGSGIFSTTAGATVTITVAASASGGSLSVTNSTVRGNTTDAAATAITDAEVSSLMGTGASAFKVRYDIVVKDVLNVNRASSATALTATVSGPGLLNSTNSTTGAVRAIALNWNGTLASLYLFNDGTAGATEVTVYWGSTVLATKKVTFTGAPKTLTATAWEPHLTVGVIDEAIEIIAKDANGNITEYTPTSSSSAPGVVSGLLSGCFRAVASDVPLGYTAGGYYCDVTGISVGTATMTIAPASLTTNSPTVDFRVTKSVAASVTLTTNKASYAPGEKITLTLTAKDADGNLLGAKAGGLKYDLLYANSSVTTSLTGSPLCAGAVATAPCTSPGTAISAGTKSTTYYAPLVSGPVTFNATVYGADVAAALALKPISVTVQVTESAAETAANAAADAAAEAIDAANAATDAANLAAEAADAATVAAEEARDAADAATAAVEELATQVATLMAALKAQITTLANTVAKIAKKVKA